MKRLPDPGYWSNSFDSVRAFRDDIDEILYIMEASGLRTTISDGQYEYDSIDELCTHRGTRPKRLAISGKSESEPYGHRAEVDFTNGMASVSLHDARSAPAGFRLRDAVMRLNFKPRYLKVWPWIVLGWLAWSARAFPYTSAPARSVALDVMVGSWIMALGILVARPRLVGVHLTRRHEGGFWKRHADKIIPALIVGVIVQLLNWILRK